MEDERWYLVEYNGHKSPLIQGYYAAAQWYNGAGTVLKATGASFSHSEIRRATDKDLEVAIEKLDEEAGEYLKKEKYDDWFRLDRAAQRLRWSLSR